MEDIERAQTRVGLDAPILRQYSRFITGLLRADLGDSLLTGQPVNEMVLQRFRPTLSLAIGAIFIAAVLGVSLGVFGAFDSTLSAMARLFITLSISTPIYWTGTLAIVLFAAQLKWLPSSGSGQWKHLILPVAVLGFHTMGGIARVTQANVADARRAAFVWVARSKGLSERYIVRRHILRISLLPVVTVIALQTGFLLGGAVITESLFVRPGIGRLLLDSVIKQDYPVVQGIVILSAAIYILVNAIADILYRFIDPRVTL